MLGTILLFIIFTLFIYFIKRVNKINDYWKDRGLPHARPLPLFGNMFLHAIKKKSLGEVLRDISLKFKDEKVVGAYNFTVPVMLINDPAYAEIVLIKEFSRFMNRGPDLKMSERRPLDKHLFALTGVDWKAVRTRMAPVFTTGKLKGMIPQISNIFHSKALPFINDNIKEELDLKSVVETFTMNVRASCVFGMDTTNLDNKSEFMTRVDAVSNFGFWNFVSLTMALWFPKIAAKLNFSVFGPHNEKYFVELLLKTFSDRLKSGSTKADFIQLLLELKQNGIVKVSQWHTDDDFLKINDSQSATMDIKNVEISDDILVAQSFIFLLAGLDTLRSTISMTLLETVRDERVMKKLQEEIDQVISKHGELSYIALGEMTYLDMCIKEAMRLYPGVEFLTRYCVKAYMFDNGVTVHPGTRVLIPVYRFHLDPEYFPDPLKFYPERFETPPPPCSYLPFGEGPRMCIAMRFAFMEMKMFISQLFYNYEVSLSSRTELPVKNDKWFILRRHITPIYLKFNKRNH